MQLNLSADDVLKTTRSVRKRLDFDKPVERAIVEECLEIALQAPTGSNSQGWHWMGREYRPHYPGYALWLDPGETRSYLIRKLAYLDALQNGVRDHIRTFAKYPPKSIVGL